MVPRSLVEMGRFSFQYFNIVEVGWDFGAPGHPPTKPAPSATFSFGPCKGPHLIHSRASPWPKITYIRTRQGRRPASRQSRL